MPRSTEDGQPQGGLEIRQELNAVRYELIVRAPLRPAVWLILRCYENGELGCSVRRTAS